MTRGLTPLVGREQEVSIPGTLGTGQRRSRTGGLTHGGCRHRQVPTGAGAEGPCGKRTPYTRWECRSAEYAQNTALFPLTDLFQRLLQFQAQDTPDEKLRKLEQMLSQYRRPLEESVQLFAPLFSLSLPDNRYPPLTLSSQRQRQKTLETIVAILLNLLNVSRCSSSWKISIGLTRQPWSFSVFWSSKFRRLPLRPC